MMGRSITLLLILVIGISYSQSKVLVPARMTFADVKLRITDKGREAIQEEVDRIMQSPKYFSAKVKKADTHFPIIEQAFKEEGVSPDFKYLSLQESALIPDAVSSSNAVGYWQFKDFTAIQMGLRVDKYVDERMNLYAASRAAARYMKKNNEYFDNWLFALQAYQMGAGGALKVLDKKLYGSKTLTITNKTYWYVRTFLAHKIAYESAVGKNPPNPELLLYNSGKGKTIQEIAKETNIEYEKLREYNLWLRKGKIPDDKMYSVILVSSDLSLVSSRLSDKSTDKVERKMPDYNTLQSNKYPIVDKKKSYSTNSEWKKINNILGVIPKNEQSVTDLARVGEIELGKFLKYNDISIDHRVKKGSPYYFKKKHAKAKEYYHVVQEDESLWSVSQKYGIRLNKLLLKNRMKKEQDVRVGRVLWLRHIRPKNVEIEHKDIVKQTAKAVMEMQELESKEPLTLSDLPLNEVEIDSIQYDEDIINIAIDSTKNDSVPINDLDIIIVKHEVKVGETLYRISKMYDVEVMQIVEWNHLKLTEDISPGQTIIVQTNKQIHLKAIPDKNINKEQDDNFHEIKYTVKTGDTMYKITKQYNVTMEEILSWNKKTNHNVSVGEVLLIKVTKQQE